ncbi:MAG TPA: OmpA family protein [Nitrospiraceae bacterium]|nr:OmpA family protein [Nitrospiraceae bacterium]
MKTPVDRRVAQIAYSAVLIMITGCASQTVSSTHEQKPPAVEERVAPEPVASLKNPKVPSSAAAQLAPGASTPFLLDIPFNFDQYALRSDAVAMVEVNANRMKEERVGKVLLEGRGDEVGTAAYNLVLGDRRAQVVKRYLEGLGLTPLEIATTSYGKDRPVCTEHSAECWEKNRTVHFEVQ